MPISVYEHKDRHLIRISGADAEDFLQNLLTQNCQNMAKGDIRAAALLTPQGKLLYECLLHKDEDFILDCDGAQSHELIKRLTFYKLRANVEIALLPHHPFTAFGVDGMNDPRHPALGTRHLEAPAAVNADLHDWHKLRFAHGIPQGAAEMPAGEIFPLEYGCHKMNFIDFQKGCFIGQEVTSRSFRRGKLRKALWPICFETAAPDISHNIMDDKNRTIGQLIATLDDMALALIRFDSLHHAMTIAGQKFKINNGLFSQADIADAIKEKDETA